MHFAHWSNGFFMTKLKQRSIISLCSDTSHIFPAIVMEAVKFVNYLLCLCTADMLDTFQVLSALWIDVLGILICISPADWVTCCIQCSRHWRLKCIHIDCVYCGWQVDLCFDQLVFRLSEYIFGYYKSRAARYFIDVARQTSFIDSDLCTLLRNEQPSLLIIYIDVKWGVTWATMNPLWSHCKEHIAWHVPYNVHAN